MAKSKLNLHKNFERSASDKELLRLIRKLKHQFPERVLSDFLLQMRKRTKAETDDLARLIKTWSKNNLPKSKVIREAIEHLKKLDSTSLRRIVEHKKMGSVKGALLEELYDSRIRQLLKTIPGKKAIRKMLKNVSEKEIENLKYFEGSKIAQAIINSDGKKTIAKLTDGMFAVQQTEVIDGVERVVLELKGVVEAKSGAFSAKGLASSLGSAKKASKSDARELFREMLDNNPEEVLSELEKIDKATASLIRKKNGSLAGDLIIDMDMDMSTVRKLVENRSLRKKTIESLNEAGQLAKDYERLSPNIGENFVRILIDGQEALVRLPNPTSKLTFISVLPKDVRRPNIPKNMRQFNHYTDKSIGIKKDELFHLARWLKYDLGRL